MTWLKTSFFLSFFFRKSWIEWMYLVRLLQEQGSVAPWWWKSASSRRPELAGTGWNWICSKSINDFVKPLLCQMSIYWSATVASSMKIKTLSVDSFVSLHPPPKKNQCYCWQLRFVLLICQTIRVQTEASQFFLVNWHQCFNPKTFVGKHTERL